MKCKISKYYICFCWFSLFFLVRNQTLFVLISLGPLNNLLDMYFSDVIDCSTILRRNPDKKGQDGVYTIYSGKNRYKTMYCDMTTEGGGWTVSRIAYVLYPKFVLIIQIFVLDIYLLLIFCHIPFRFVYIY